MSLITKTRFLAGDPNSERWTSNTEIYEALSIAQRLFVIGVLGSPQFKDNFEVFAELTRSQTVSIGVAGYDLSGLTYPMARNGYINSKTVLEGLERWITRLPQSKLGLLNNQYFRGNNWTPKCYLEGNTYQLLIDTGSYPAQVTIKYVKVPSDVTSELEINDLFDDVICIMAEAHLRRSIEDFEQAAFIQKTIIEPAILQVATGQVVEPKTHTVGQYMRDRGTA